MDGLFLFWGKVQKNSALEHQLESEKKVNLVLGENHDDLHLKQGQRSAPQSAQKSVSKRKASLLNSVQRKYLEDQNLVLHHQELECRRAAPQSVATRNRI